MLRTMYIKVTGSGHLRTGSDTHLSAIFQSIRKSCPRPTLYSITLIFVFGAIMLLGTVYINIGTYVKN